MAVATRRLADRYIATMSPSRRRGTYSARILAGYARQAAPCVACMVVLASPFAAFTGGMSRLTAASNRRVLLQERLRMRRVEITTLRVRLQELRDPKTVAQWAAAHDMVQATDVYIVKRPDHAESR